MPSVSYGIRESRNVEGEAGKDCREARGRQSLRREVHPAWMNSGAGEEGVQKERSMVEGKQKKAVKVVFGVWGWRGTARSSMGGGRADQRGHEKAVRLVANRTSVTVTLKGRR